MNLEEVLEEYASATPAGNDLNVLQVFSGKYPQYAEELADFAAARAVVKHAPEEELTEEEEAKLQKSGLNNLRSVLGSLNSANTLTSLVETAKTKGLSRAKFAGALGLSTSLVIYLEKRRLNFATIPQKIIAKLAQILETGEEAISVYLKQSPQFAENTSFKTETRAVTQPPKDFAEAVREDQQLSPEEKRKLLEL